MNADTKNDVKIFFASPLEIDLEKIADEFVGRVGKDLAEALSFLNLGFRYLPLAMHRTLGRLIEVRLNHVTRSLLSKNYKGSIAMLAWRIDKMQGPRMPQPFFATPHYAFAFYSSLVGQYGSIHAQQSLKRGEPVLLALRKQSSTLAHKGRGSYDDQIVVLNALNIKKYVKVFPACTEPGAQYSQRAAPLAGGRVDPRYAGVAYRKADGFDLNKDGIKDAGRLEQGTYLYFEKKGGFLGARAFQVKTSQIAERDINGDGLFTDSDLDRFDKTGVGTSMYIHRGGADRTSDPNTWSAGCQTIPMNVYNEFLASLRKHSPFYYVLVNTIN